MRLTRVFLITIALVFTLIACGGGGGGGSGSNGGTSDTQDSFSQSILLKNGAPKQGTPPPSSNSQNAPKISGNPSSITQPIDKVAKISTTISAQSPLSKIFVQVEGDENNFFEVPPTSGVDIAKDESSSLRVEFKEIIAVEIAQDFPQDLLDQEFCVRISAEDDNGLVSDPSEPTCLEVSNSQTPNVAPIADAGRNLGVQTGSEARLDGSKSTDPDGDEITYAWTLTDKPSNSNASLSDTTSPVTALVPDVDGRYVVELVVTDSKNSSSHTSTAEIDASPDNAIPLANAGPDLTVQTGTSVSLDGRNSTDADDQTLTFNWIFFTRPNDSTANLNDASLAAPSFTADLDGQYVLALIVNDGIVDSEPDTVIVTSSSDNSAPIANAGSDATANIGASITLNGSQSSDVNGDPLTYRWSLNSTPTGSQAQLIDPTSVNPSFTPDIAGDYVVELVVNDGTLDSAPDTVIITAGSGDNPPLANAGADQQATIGQTVQLDGGNSSDPENSPLTFLWTFTAQPPASAVQLVNETAANPSFVPDVAGDYVVQLVVNDGALDSQPDTVVISVGDSTNPLPVANAGPDQENIVLGAQVNLDGSQSADPEGETITFQWTFQSTPDGSQAALVGATTATPSLTADVEGQYVVQLVVTDASGQAGEPDVVVITTQSQAPTTGIRQNATMLALQQTHLMGLQTSAGLEPAVDDRKLDSSKAQTRALLSMFRNL